MKQKSNTVQRLIIVIGLSITLLAFGGGYALSKTNHKAAAKGAIQKNCDGTCVSLYDEAADPLAITIMNGSYVQFNVADAKKHNLYLGDESAHHNESVGAYSSGDFENDEAWRVQFKKDGAYTFKDKYHPKLSVSVIVYTPGKDYKIQN